MNRSKRAVALLLFLLLLLSPWAAFAEGENEDTDASREYALTLPDRDQEIEAKPARVSVVEEGLRQQIRDTYAAAKKRARRKSFKGYCGAYVANQLVVLGINTSYLSANGKNTYDIYRKLDCTTGGYDVFAYGAKKYSMMEALHTILDINPAPTNILVGFQKGTSSAGKKYGHVLFIHGIRDGRVYFSDSCARTVEDVRYKEGEPIVCSLAAFADQYRKYKLDGVVYFVKADDQSSSIAETTSSSSEKSRAQG